LKRQVAYMYMGFLNTLNNMFYHRHIIAVDFLFLNDLTISINYFPYVPLIIIDCLFTLLISLCLLLFLSIPTNSSARTGTNFDKKNL